MYKLKGLLFPVIPFLVMTGCGGSEVSAKGPLGARAGLYYGNFKSGNRSFGFSITLPPYPFEPGFTVVRGQIAEISIDNYTRVDGTLDGTATGGDLDVKSDTRDRIELEGSLEPSGKEFVFTGSIYGSVHHDPDVNFVLKHA